MKPKVGKESMPKPPTHTLIWSAQSQTYALVTPDHPPQEMVPGNEEAWVAWLTTHSSFSFHGQSGSLSVLKESRKRGAGYWYAYHTKESHTRKRYLGRSAIVTLACLEEAAQDLGSEPTSIPLAQAKNAPSSERQGVLLSSKLSPPRLPNSLVERARLLIELDAVCSHSLTLISASAGSGKTTLLSAWATAFSSRQEERRRTTGGEPAFAWLSLDVLDNDTNRFWVSVIAALRTRLPKLGETALALLDSSQPPSLSTILTNLLNEIVQAGRELILILDDYHVIEDEAIHDSLLFLLDHLPGSLHLVLATRTDPELPLSRFRVRGQLLEIRSSDLRFTQQEATSFLVQRMGLPLAEEDVAILSERTEGWIAGLQLAALSLRKRQDLAAWVSDFAGSHRFVLDYVQQDILARLPLPLQDFLLQTSILTRMHATLCQVITAQSSREVCQQMLEEMERANLFVVPLDELRQWYRYHDLFREALRARLHASQPELVPFLHIRAARWYETQGEWREAIAHALAAPDYPYAASLIEQAAPHFWLGGQARTIHTWVLALPDPVFRAYTRLALNAALRFLDSVSVGTETLHASMATQVERTITRMQEILHRKPSLLLSEAEVALIERRLRLLHALLEVRGLFKRGDYEGLRHLAEVSEALPSDEEVNWNMIALSFIFSLTLTIGGEVADLRERLLAMKQQAMQAGDHLTTIRVMRWLARAYEQAGQLHQVHREALSALALVEQTGGYTSMAGYLHYYLFNVSYSWNRLEEASDSLRRLIHIGQEWQQVDLLILGQVCSARLALARGDLSTAQEALQKLEALVEREGFAEHAPWVVQTRVRLWLASRNLAQASEWATQTTLSPKAWDPLRKGEVLLLARVLLAQQQYTQAVQHLDRFREHLDRPADSEPTIEWLALHVVALHLAGEHERAARGAARLLQLSEPEGCIRVYLEAGKPMKQVLKTWLSAPLQDDPTAPEVSVSRPYVSRLLTAFEQEERRPSQGRDASPVTRHKALPQFPQSAAERALIEPLSLQELKVLHRLCAGQTYAEIAEALVVSINTIKTQVSSIYRKLGVSRRAEAMTVAAQLHLL
jgi:LuxR family transcriptional regulator, maltose regulon positive regulatory protein